jgi:hypothetical protein
MLSKLQQYIKLGVAAHSGRSTLGKTHNTRWIGRWNGAEVGCGRCGVEINLSLPGIEPRFAGRPAPSLDIALRCAGAVHLWREEIYVFLHRKMLILPRRYYLVWRDGFPLQQQAHNFRWQSVQWKPILSASMQLIWSQARSLFSTRH